MFENRVHDGRSMKNPIPHSPREYERAQNWLLSVTTPPFTADLGLPPDNVIPTNAMEKWYGMDYKRRERTIRIPKVSVGCAKYCRTILSVNGVHRPYNTWAK